MASPHKRRRKRAIADLLGGTVGSATLVKEALEYIYKSIEIQPKNFLAYCNLGDIFSTTGEYKKAISIYEKALNLSENNVIAKIGLIHCKGIICDWSNNDICSNWIDNIGIKGEPANPYTFFL